MDPPDTAPPPPPRPAGVPAGDRDRARRADRARQAFVAPWSRQRARRVGLVALVLIIVGPLLGTAFALLLVPAQPPDIVPFDDERPAVIDAQGTIRAVDTTTGEMALRLTLTGNIAPPEGAPEVFDTATGALTEDLILVVIDADGQGFRTLREGQVPGTVTIPVPITDSRATRYPVDRYRSTILVLVQRARDTDQTVPLRLSLRSSDPGFSVQVEEDRSSDEAAVVDLRVSRRGTVIGWAGFFVMVCWLLAIAAASLGWTTVVHGIAAPGWSMGFLIGVLFALPPLRNALPGAPPSGSLVDLAAFYWAVGIVALTLVAMIGSWNIRVRRAPSEPDSPKPRV